MGGDIIAVAALLWEVFGSGFSDEIEQGLKQRWRQFGWRKAGERYLTNLYEEHSIIRPLGSPGPIELDKIFIDVYILEKQTAHRRFDIHELHTDPGLLDRRDRSVERVAVQELMQRKESHRLYVLGSPGAGKTTVLKHLTIQAIKNSNEETHKIPIFISLKRWADSKMALMEYISHEFAICEFPDAQLFITHILQKGRAHVLFDGLDEIPQADGQRNRAIAELRDFARQYHASPCLITCRRAAVEYTFEHFNYVELADFTEEQISDMVTKWFAHDSEKKTRLLADFEREENRGVSELAKTPLLLALLCLAFERNSSLPQRRVEIYRDAIDALLREWDAKRNIVRDDLLLESEELYKAMSPDRKHQMLAEVAINTFIKGLYFSDQDTLKALLAGYMQNLPEIENANQIDSLTVLKAIEAQHGILVTRAERIHSFAHLSFQEYFAAMAIKEEASAATFEWLFDRFLSDNRWREVFILTASALKEASTFLVHFRNSVDQFIAGDEILEAAAQHVQQLALASAGDSASEQTRRVYWCTLLARSSVRDKVTARGFSREIIHFVNHVYKQASSRLSARTSVDIASTSDFVRSLSSTREFIRDRKLFPARALLSSRVLPNAPVLAQEIKQAVGITDPQQFYSEVTRLLPEVLGLLSERLQQLVAEPDYALLRDNSFAVLIPDLVPLVLEIQRDADPRLVRALSIYLATLADQSKGSCYPGLDTALAALVIPSADAGDAAWNTFVQQIPHLPGYIDRVLRWELSEKQAARLEQYFRVVNLLEECLDVAYAAHRIKVRNSLLLSPGAWQPNGHEVSHWGL